MRKYITASFEQKNIRLDFYISNNYSSDPGNSNCQGKLKLLRIIGVSSYRGFEQKDQKHLIKSGFMLAHVLLQDF